VEITVLGKSPAWQDVGGACSGYLVRDGDFALLLDCGNGVFGKLREVCDYVDISAVLISHLHADHVLDLVPFSYALSYAPRQQPVPVDGWPGTEHRARPHLYAPPGSQDFFRRVVGSWGDAALIENAFTLEEYEAGDELILGPLTVRFCEVPHYTLTHAVDIRARSGRRLTFSADCSPNHELPAFARDTDLLLIEATLPRPERTGERGHLTSREAGEHAQRARARRLVLTHFSDELDVERVLAEAREGFGDDVELATQGAAYTV
jgi:ribonuclease BN (tRNA processing enzyme)